MPLDPPAMAIMEALALGTKLSLGDIDAAILDALLRGEYVRVAGDALQLTESGSQRLLALHREGHAEHRKWLSERRLRD